MRKTKKQNYLKTGIFLLGIAIFLWNCQEEELLNIETISQESNLKVRKILLEELKTIQNLEVSLQNISKKFDINKNKFIQNKNSIISNDNSFTILTDNILEAELDSITTYSFRIETPTDSSSSFENFIIIQKNELLNFFIYKYQFDETSTDDFPYNIKVKYVDENQINSEDFNNYTKDFTLFWGGCWWYYESHGHGTLIFCPADNSDNDLDGQGSDDSGWNGASTTGTSNSNNTLPNNNIGIGSSGDISNSVKPRPAGIIFTPQEQALNDIRECLNPSVQINLWLNQQTKTLNNNLFSINNYLQQNDCSTESQEFVEEAIEALMNDEVENFEKFLENTVCTELNSLTNNPYVKTRLSQLLSTAPNHQYEEAFRIKKDPANGQLQAGNIYNNGVDCSAVDVRLDVNTIAYVHTHPNGCNIDGMYSAQDVLIMANLAQTFNNGQNNFADLTFMLVNNGTVYALKFDNAQAVNNLINLLNDKEELGNFQRTLSTTYSRLNAPGNTNNIFDFQEKFIKHLQNFNLGISLFQAETNNLGQVTNWNKRTLNTDNNSIVESTSCN